jgi:hypothetical protein
VFAKNAMEPRKPRRENPAKSVPILLPTKLPRMPRELPRRNETKHSHYNIENKNLFYIISGFTLI